MKTITEPILIQIETSAALQRGDLTTAQKQQVFERIISAKLRLDNIYYNLLKAPDKKL